MNSQSYSSSTTMLFLVGSFLLTTLLCLSSSANGQQIEGGDAQQPFMFEDYLIQPLDKRGPMKKADVSDFIGSLNGASRLRYGKRSLWDPAPVQWNGYRALIPFRQSWQMAKRVPSAYAEALPAGLLDQLNGAERLRFGRK